MSGGSNSNKKRKIDPDDENELISRGRDFVLILGADVKSNCQAINKILDTNKAINVVKSWEFVDIHFRNWLCKYSEDPTVNEAPIVTDDDLCKYFNDKCGAKNFIHWFSRLRARSNATALMPQGFYNNNDEDRRNSRRDDKVKRRKNRNNCNNNNSRNGSDDSEFDITQLDGDSVGLDDESDFDSNMKDGDDEYEQINNRQQKRLQHKRFKSSCEDLVSYILALGYTRAGLDSDSYLNRLKGFYKNTKLKISEIKSVDQLDRTNKDLPTFLLLRYFEYLLSKCKSDVEKVEVAGVRKAVCEEFILKYALQIIPLGLNNQLIKLINLNTKAPQFLAKFRESMDIAIKDPDYKVGWNYLSKDLICLDKSLAGVCPDLVSCNLIHGCAACGWKHPTGSCKRLKNNTRRMIKANHIYNFNEWRKNRYSLGGGNNDNRKPWQYNGNRKPWQNNDNRKPWHKNKPWQNNGNQTANNPNNPPQGQWQWIANNPANNPPSNPPNNPQNQNNNNNGGNNNNGNN